MLLPSVPMALSLFVKTMASRVAPVLQWLQPSYSLPPRDRKKGQKEKSEKTFEKKIVQWVKQKLHTSREK